jgi:hypothetical protein
VYHEGSKSLGRDAPQRLYYGARNQLLLASRVSQHQSLPARALRTTGIVLLNIAHATRGESGPVIPGLMAVARGVRDYASGVFGRAR